MKQKLHLKRYILAAVLAGIAGTAIAEDRTVTEEAVAVLDDRYGAIAGIVAMWEPTWGENEGWEEELTAALNGATDTQILSIQGATSYGAVNAILLGISTSVSLDGVAGTEDLGDSSADLVYTPVFPCRFYDTRNVGAAPGNNAINSYRVFGSGAAMSAQGGNAAGCPAPKTTHPVGVSLNLAAVPVSSSGHLRVWPYLGVQPTASFVNYFGGGNIANSGLVTVCVNCGDDISVFNRNTAHSFADAMGYFYPADAIGNLVETRQGGYDYFDGSTLNSTDTIVTDTANFRGANSGSTTITVQAGDEVQWTASTQVFKTAGIGNTIEGTLHACYRNTSTGVITDISGFNNETDFCVASLSDDDQSSVQVSGRVASMPAGSYEFGFCPVWGSSYTCGNLVTNFRTGGTKINVTKYSK